MDDNEKRQHAERAVQLLAEQNLAVALIAGTVATILAAAAYGAVVVTWPYFHGFAAAGVGIIVGFPIGFLGRGILTRFAVIASVYTIVGCLLGNVFASAINTARNERSSLIDIFGDQSASIFWDWATADLSLVHVVYWLIAIACAAFLSRRPLSRADRLALGLYSSS